MEKYACSVCGYIYDPEEGDSTAGLKEGTNWENVPDEYHCPLCGAFKDCFEEISKSR